MRNECNLSLKKADFHFIERNSPAKLEERHDRENTDINETLKSLVQESCSLITVGVKKSRPAKKRKMEGYVSSGTVTGHYISFLKMTFDELDKHPHTYHCYVDTPPSSPRIANTVISNYEAINCQ